MSTSTHTGQPSDTPPGALPSGATIGILGGGQLGRMIAQAAAQLGYRTHVFCPQHDSPAAQVSVRATTADYEDRAALDAFADSVDVVTPEFENLPFHALARIQQRGTPVFPDPEILAICQERLREKRFIQSCGLPTAPFRALNTHAQLRDALERIGLPAVIKRARFGYDGKGQVLIDHHKQGRAAWAKLKFSPCIYEGFVAFEREASIIVARSQTGEVRTYPVVQNLHTNHILHKTLAPAPDLTDTQRERAEHIAHTLADALNLVGVLAIELFLTTDDVLVNELAPRPHNSGHWTIEGCACSQFEQLVRVLTGLPLGDTTARVRAEMTNILGDEIHDIHDACDDPNAHVHVYGKYGEGEIRPGRKMGHITRILGPL